MNNMDFKIKLLCGLFVSIIIFCVVMFSQTKFGNDIHMPMVTYIDEVDSLIERRIPSPRGRVDFKPKNNYVQMMDEIETERLLGKIDDKLADSCKCLVFDRFTDYVLKVSKNILQKGNWNVQIMHDLEINNKILQGTRFCDDKTRSKSSYNISVVKDYKNALAVISSSPSYDNDKETKKVIEDSKIYVKKNTLKTCKKLLADLDGVQGVLYEKHKKQVKNMIAKFLHEDSSEDVNKAELLISKFVSMCSMYNKSYIEVASSFDLEKEKISKRKMELQRIKCDRIVSPNDGNERNSTGNVKKKRKRLFHRIFKDE